MKLEDILPSASKREHDKQVQLVRDFIHSGELSKIHHAKQETTTMTKEELEIFGDLLSTK